MALTAVIPKSFPDLHLLAYAYKVVGLPDIFAVTLQRERKVLSWCTGEGVRLTEVTPAQSQVLSWSGTVRQLRITAVYSHLGSSDH